MRYAIPAAVSLLVLAPLASPANADPTAKLSGGRLVEEPVTFANLTLFPVSAPSRKATVDYLVLDEGMENGKIVIQEQSEEGNVNELTLTNRSDQPLFVMAGEVVIGGKQDRIIGKNTVVAARSTETIPVFCVEHGRWSGRKAEFSTAKALAHKELRKKASYEGQSEVWQEVKSKNQKRGTSNKTDTYRDVAKGKKVKRATDDYKKQFDRMLSESRKSRSVVGYVVAIGGKVVAIETFGSPKLFRKLEGKILQSYYVEAVDASSAPDAKKKPNAKAVEAFEKKARQARRSKSKLILDKKAAKTRQYEDGDLKGTVVEAPDSAEPVYESTLH